MTVAPRTLIVGSDGLVGAGLLRHLRAAGTEVLGTTRRPDQVSPERPFLDLDRDPNDWVCPGGVTAAALCAARTGLEACARDPGPAARVNVCHTAVLAARLAERGVFVVYLSSGAVFDGSRPYRRPGDPVAPRTEYGRQKAEAESRLRELGPGAAIVRLTKVAESVRPLLSGWRDALRAGAVVRPFADMVMAPVPLDFVAGVVARVLATRRPGTLHVSGTEDVSYAEVARHLARREQADPGLVRPVPSAEAGIPPEAVPRHTTLDTTDLAREWGLRAPSPYACIDRVLAS